MLRWVSYQNGNYRVLLNTTDGTKTRITDEDDFIPSTIESMDIKITNCCDMGCKCCHENSTPNGNHADLTFGGTFLENLHPYTELAIGGGNPLEHPQLEEFLINCKDKKLIPSMTVNKAHFERNFDYIKHLYDDHLIYGLGVSVLSSDISDKFIQQIVSIPSAVIHVIAGMVSVDVLERLSKNNIKILILGYKRFRRGESLYEKDSSVIDAKINSLSELLPKIISDKWFRVVSFDNLALRQLQVKTLLGEDYYNQFYMGDDGIDGELTSATMYVDMVERKFARNSCSPARYGILPTVEQMYTFLREENNDEGLLGIPI